MHRPGQNVSSSSVNPLEEAVVNVTEVRLADVVNEDGPLGSGVFVSEEAGDLSSVCRCGEGSQ